MSNPVAKFYGTPLGKNKFYEMFMEKAASETFVSKIMKPMPMIVKTMGPLEASRHWDWKARSDFDIILPEKKTMIVFDEAVKIKEEDWRVKYEASAYSGEMLEGSFANVSESTKDSVLTVDKLKKAMGSLGEDIMGRKKIPKKKKAKGDPRRSKYGGRMFGNVLLASTSQITNNTTLNDTLVLEGDGVTTVEELIVPLFEEFFHNHGNEWQVIGPMTLAAQSVETSKWKSVSALGGEILNYHSVVIGKRDGICVKWVTGNIVGLDEEMMIDTPIKTFGDKLVSAEFIGNPANGTTLVDTLLKFSGEADIVTAAEEAKERVRLAIKAELKKDIDRKSEAYGESFGSWA